MGTAMALDGTVTHQTPIHGLPLPPPIEGRAQPVFNGNGQYRLPDPVTGKLTSYTRASTVAKTLEDTWMLDGWAKRTMLIGMRNSTALRDDLERVVTDHLASGGEERTMARDLRNSLDTLSDTAQERAGSKLAAEFGTAVHAWCEWVDLELGHICKVPEMYRPWVRGHRRVLAENCLSIVPGWTERIVLNTRWGIAGTLDHLVRDIHGTVLLGDKKTSKGLDYSWLYFAIQLAIYHGASHALSLDGTTWETIPAVDPDIALISHLPREDPDASRIVPINMVFGSEALFTAMTVRRHRTRAEKQAQSVLYDVSSNNTRETRFYAARYLLETSETEADMARVWEEYQDIWTPELTVLGQTLLQLAAQ